MTVSELFKARNKLGVDNNTVLTAKTPQPIVIQESFMDALSHQDLFTPLECADIIKTQSPDEWLQAGTVASNKDDTLVANLEYRSSKNSFLQPNAENAWVFDRLLAVSLKANERYQFHIDFFDAVQIARYDEGDFYDWHFDAGSGRTGNRKLSLTLQLSAADDYEGGDLILDVDVILDGDHFYAPREVGSVTLFPSFLKHKVSPVTKGTRYSIVAWCSGTDRFK